jgi:ComF family protein
MNLFQTMHRGWLDWLFPSYCAGCHQRRTPPEKPLCYQCLSELALTTFENQQENTLDRLFWGRIPLQSVTAEYVLKPNSALQQSLHQLKYHHRPGVGVYLGKMAGERMKQNHRHQPIDALIPLPLHERKKRIRGYNQAERICQGIAQTTGIPVWDTLVVRNQHTETQTQKDREQRWANMHGKFSLHRPEQATHKHVLLVDDVLTTGATLEACGQTLLQIPGIQLSLFALAYTENS